MTVTGAQFDSASGVCTSVDVTAEEYGDGQDRDQHQHVARRSGPGPGRARGVLGGGWFDRYGGPDLAEWAALETREAMDAAGLLLGRRSDEWFAARWIGRSGHWADRLNSLPKYVVSSTPGEPRWTNATVISGDVVAEIEKLKATVDGELLVYASYELSRHPDRARPGRRAASGRVPRAARHRDPTDRRSRDGETPSSSSTRARSAPGLPTSGTRSSDSAGFPPPTDPAGGGSGVASSSPVGKPCLLCAPGAPCIAVTSSARWSASRSPGPAAGCSNPASSPEPAAVPPSASADAAFPATVTHRYGTTTVPPAPQRIVTLGQTDHDAVIALGSTPIALAGFVDSTYSPVRPWNKQASPPNLPSSTCSRSSSRSWRRSAPTSSSP